MIDSVLGLSIFSYEVILMRLGLAALAGFIVGFERERHNQPAGLRTHMILSMGACLIMLTSIYVPLMFNTSNPNADPGRISAQVVSGIGFLGAGAIVRFGFDVRGLTTATSIWTISGIGLAIGSGLYFLGMVSSVMLVIILQFFDIIENYLVPKKVMRSLWITYDAEGFAYDEILSLMKENTVKVKKVSIEEDVSGKRVDLKMDCRMGHNLDLKNFFDVVKSSGKVYSIRLG